MYVGQYQKWSMSFLKWQTIKSRYKKIINDE